MGRRNAFRNTSKKRIQSSVLFFFRKLSIQYLTMITITKDLIFNIINQGVNNDSSRELMANSLYYYCCGSDATPIIAFGGKYPLYIYVDTVQYGNGDFNNETKKLYLRLSKAGFQKTENVHIEEFVQKNVQSKPIIKQLDLTRWSSNNGDFFYLLYAQGDAQTVFCKLYSDVDRGGNNNYIQPKCVCNFRYEIAPSNVVECSKNNYNPIDVLHHVEKRVEYIMGEVHDEKYKKVGDYEYYGDYGTGAIPIFKRICYYVF
ncbi:MAG: hypothetical protein J6X58_00870 [Bacteroidales bacterium]|nr:hypothetical protein [Bacteroidales bacterium]